MKIGKIIKVNKDENGNILSIEVEKEHSGTHNNGYIFKDFEAYERGLDEICYVPEYCSVNENNETLDFYTHRDFLELCGGQEEIASMLFEMVDWQYPETLIEELFENELE